MKNQWFVSLTKLEQKGFWKIKKSFVLEGSGGHFYLGGRINFVQGKIIAALRSTSKNPCYSQTQRYCYIYNKSHL